MNEKFLRLLESIDRCLRTATPPVAVKLITNEMGDIKRPKGIVGAQERLGHRVAVCQAMTLARRYGWGLAIQEKDFACPPSMVYMGYYPEDTILQGRNAMGGYCIDDTAGKRMERANPALPMGLLKEIWIAPLTKEKFDPDMVVVYGNAAQISRLIHAANYLEGRGLACSAYARAACSMYIVKAFLEKENVFLVPNGGERVFGMAQDDEIIFSIPENRVEDLILGLEETHKAGLVRYPTPYQGLMAEPVVPDKYWKVVPETAWPEAVRERLNQEQQP